MIAELNKANFDDTVIDGLTVVDFWAPWCGPCRALAPQIEKAAQARPNARFVKVNTDEEPELAARFGIQALPTVGVFVDGQLVDRLVGLRPAAQFVEAVDAHTA